MRGILAGSLSLFLGVLAVNAYAADAPGARRVIASTDDNQSAAPGSVMVPAARNDEAPASTPAVSLDRPMGSEGQRIVDPQVQPSSYNTEAPAVVRSTSPEEVPLPLPSGPPLPKPRVLKSEDDSTSKLKTSTPVMSDKPRPLEAIASTGPCTCASSPAMLPTTGDLCGACNGSSNCNQDCCAADCGDICCDGCNEGGCPWGDFGRTCHHWWFRGEYLAWSIKNAPAPALATTSPVGTLGRLGENGTSVLFGGPIDQEEMSGGRFNVGYWIDESQTWGIEGTLLYLSKHTVNFTNGSGGNPQIFRPFTDELGNQQSEAVAGTNLPTPSGPMNLAGSIHIASSSQLYGAELNGLFNIDRCCWCRLDLLGGFRFLNLKESLNISESGTDTRGDRFSIGDQFATRNEFYGGQIGLRTEFYWRRWQLDLTTKIAIGDMSETATINGSDTITPAGGAAMTSSGGLLAQPGNNIGTHRRNTFAVVPEFGLNLGYQFNDHWRGYVGYDFLYMSDVLRPGDQIGPVNKAQIGGNPPSGPQPKFQFKQTDFWAQGAHLGLEYRF